MDPQTYAGFLDCMKRIDAEEMLKAYKVQDWPNTKEKSRSQEVKRLEKQANLNSNNVKKVTNEELQRFIGGL